MRVMSVTLLLSYRTGPLGLVQEREPNASIDWEWERNNELSRDSERPRYPIECYAPLSTRYSGFFERLGSRGYIHGAIEICIKAGRTSAPGGVVHKYQCGLPVQRFAAVLFEPEHHGDSVIRLSGLYVTRQNRFLPRHPLYRLHRYWKTHKDDLVQKGISSRGYKERTARGEIVR